MKDFHIQRQSMRDVMVRMDISNTRIFEIGCAMSSVFVVYIVFIESNGMGEPQPLRSTIFSQFLSTQRVSVGIRIWCIPVRPATQQRVTSLDFPIHALLVTGPA